MHGMMAAHHQQQQQQPMIPREPSPPPKPDGSECHRSQSAIFTRMWNRGEGNSCSRTDMIFKPVPDSKLARKREERIRKACDREEAMKAAAENAGKRGPQSIQSINQMGPPGGHGAPPHPLFSPTNPGTCTAVGKKVVPRLRDSRLLTPSGQWARIHAT